jgi:calcineurin-like phosphoesterase family protein
MDWNVPPEIPRQPGRKKLWVTADEHYGHRRIIGYQSRPFGTPEEMDAELIRRHNCVVSAADTVIHVGDFSFGRAADFHRTASSLHGVHFFMDGSHDRSMREFFSSPDYETHRLQSPHIKLLPKLFEFTYGKTKVVLCHYALHSWWASHHRGSSVHLHGHSHGRFSSPFCAIDIGVDTNNFYPYLVEDALALAQAKAPSP